MSTVTFDILARDRASATFRRVAGETEGLTHRLDSLRTMARRVVTAIGLFEVGKELTNFARDSVQAYAEAQTAQARLSDAYKRFPALANVQIGSLRKINEQLQAKTGSDHNALAAGEASLAQFNLTGRAIKSLIPLVNDYAVKTGQDVPTAATAIGRALLGNTRALKTIGIEFKATGNQAKDAATITQLLRDKLGGFATHEGKTAAGQAKIMGAEFRDVKEQLGRALLPSLLSVGRTLTGTVLPAISRFTGFIRSRVMPTVNSWVGSLRTHLAPALRVVWSYISGTLVPALQRFAGFIVGRVVPALVHLERSLVGGLRSAFNSVRGAIEKHKQGLQTLWDVFKGIAGFIITKVVPILGGALGFELRAVGKVIGVVITEVGYLGDAFRSVANFFTGPFLRAAGTMVSGLVRGLKYIAEVWFSVVGALIHGAASAFGWVPGVGGKLKAAASQFDGFRTHVLGVFSDVANGALLWGAQAGSNFASAFDRQVAGLSDHAENLAQRGIFGKGKGGKGKGKGGKTSGASTFAYDPTALATAGTTAGKAAGNGVAKGLSSAVSTVVSAAKQIVDKINQQFKTLKDSARQLAQSIADTMRATVDLTSISQTDSLGAAFAPTIASIKSYLRTQVTNDRQFRRLLRSERARGLSTALFRQLAQAGPAAAGGIVQALAGASRSDLRQISGLSAQAGRIGLNLGRSVSHDVYGARLREAHHDAREANRLLAKLVAATKGNHLSAHDVRALGKEYDDALRHLRITTDTGKQDHKQGQRVLAG